VVKVVKVARKSAFIAKTPIKSPKKSAETAERRRDGLGKA
jgi:hypothetical protein